MAAKYVLLIFILLLGSCTAYKGPFKLNNADSWEKVKARIEQPNQDIEIRLDSIRVIDDQYWGYRSGKRTTLLNPDMTLIFEVDLANSKKRRIIPIILFSAIGVAIGLLLISGGPPTGL